MAEAKRDQSLSIAAAATLATAAGIFTYLKKQKKNPSGIASRALAIAEESLPFEHARTSKEEIQDLRKKHFSLAVSVSYSNTGGLMIVKGRGSKLFDNTNREFLDTRNNVSHVGHCNPQVVQAVQDQVGQLNTNTRYLHPNVTLLAEQLANLLPPPLQVVFFVNSGSEANDLALRLAYAHSGGSKNRIVVDRAYHGHTLSCLEISPYKYEQSKEFQLIQPSSGATCLTPNKHVWKVPCPDLYRGEHREEDSETAAAKYAEYVQEACDVFVEKRGEKVSCFVMECGMSVGGVILPPKEYFPAVAKSVREAGGVFIADEIQTGFGRLGTSLWAFQHEQSEEDPFVPDIVTVGKAFGNGMPLAAVVTTPEVAQAFESMGVEYFNTFGGNPVSAAAGLAMLDVLEHESLQQHARETGGYLQQRFGELQQRLDLIGDVRGSGFFIGVELVRCRESLEPATEETSFVCSVLKDKYSILTSIDGFYHNVLVIKPPMVFSKEDADYFVKSFEVAVIEDLASADLQSVSRTPT